LIRRTVALLKISSRAATTGRAALHYVSECSVKFDRSGSRRPRVWPAVTAQAALSRRSSAGTGSGVGVWLTGADVSVMGLAAWLTGSAVSLTGLAAWLTGAVASLMGAAVWLVATFTGLVAWLTVGVAISLSRLSSSWLSSSSSSSSSTESTSHWSSATS